MRRALIGGALLAVVSLSGCANESTADKSSGGPGAAGTDSTTGTSAATQSPSASPPYSERAWVDDCPNQMENSPAEFDPSGGTYAAHITDFPTPESPLTFDVVQWMTGGRARDAFEKESGDPNGGLPNDYNVANESTQTRSAPLADDARVWLTFFSQGATIMPKSATIEELPAYVKSAGPEIEYWLTFEDGKITELCEQWVLREPGRRD